MNILVLGVTGMLGNAVFRVLMEDSSLCVYGSARREQARCNFSGARSDRLLIGVDVENYDSLVRTFAAVRPEVVVNCIGLVKQLADANDPLLAVPINTLLPHRLAALCQAIGARLVHISTDCVFSGAKGNYQESDFPDAYDLYGRTKLLGEVDYAHAITLRTSIIGHELAGQRSLISWFLAQQQSVRGFTRAVFSGLPTVELARVIRNVVLQQPNIHGLYHVAAKPIDKCALLNLVAQVYGKHIQIVPDDSLVIDRSLDAARFREATGYVAPEWPTLIQQMHAFK
jgi:dTDP-4-dehydrorhamnose reductase